MTFNINIKGANGQVLKDIEAEITRIFATGGLRVVFNQPAIGRPSANLNVVTRYTGEAAAHLRKQGQSPTNPGIPGVSPATGNNSYVNRQHLFFATNHLSKPGRTSSHGTRIGRVGAHEVIQHRFLGVGVEGSERDVTASYRIDENGVVNLAARATTRYDISQFTAAGLRGRCARGF